MVRSTSSRSVSLFKCHRFTDSRHYLRGASTRVKKCSGTFRDKTHRVPYAGGASRIQLPDARIGTEARTRVIHFYCQKHKGTSIDANLYSAAPPRRGWQSGYPVKKRMCLLFWNSPCLVGCLGRVLPWEGSLFCIRPAPLLVLARFARQHVVLPCGTLSHSLLGRCPRPRQRDSSLWNPTLR